MNGLVGYLEKLPPIVVPEAKRGHHVDSRVSVPLPKMVSRKWSPRKTRVACALAVANISTPFPGVLKFFKNSYFVLLRTINGLVGYLEKLPPIVVPEAKRGHHVDSRVSVNIFVGLVPCQSPTLSWGLCPVSRHLPP